MQALIIFDSGTANQIKMSVAGVGHVIYPQKRIFRDREAWELRGSGDQCDLLEVACLALDTEYYRIDI